MNFIKITCFFCKNGKKIQKNKLNPMKKIEQNVLIILICIDIIK